MITTENQPQKRIDVGGAISDSLRVLSEITRTNLDIHTVIDPVGRISNEGREIARATLNTMLDSGLSFDEINNNIKAEFAILRQEQPHAIKELRKLEISMRLGLLWQTTKTISTEPMLAKQYPVEKNEHPFKYATRIAIYELNSTLTTEQIEERRSDLAPTIRKQQDRADLFAIAERTVKLRNQEQIEKRRIQLALENEHLVKEAIRVDTNSIGTENPTTSILSRLRIFVRDGWKSFKDDMRPESNTTARRLLPILSGISIVLVLLLLSKFASVRGFAFSDYLNDLELPTQPIGVQVPESWELEKYEQMLQIQEIVADAVDQGLTEEQSEVVNNTITENLGIVVSEKSKISENEKLVITDEEIVSNNTTQDTKTVAYPKAVLGAENDTLYMSPAEYKSYQEKVAFINKWERPDLVVERTPTGFTVKHIQISPLAEDEYYRGKPHNAAFAADQMNKTMQRMGSLTPGEMIGLIKDMFVDFSQTNDLVENGYVKATYWSPALKQYETHTGSGTCWNVTVRNWAQMIINKIADDLGYPPIFLFMNQWTGNISAKNINQTHNIDYPYETYQLWENRVDGNSGNDLAPGWTIAEENGVGKPDNFSALNPAFVEEMEKLGWDVRVSIYMGFYYTDPSKTDMQVPGHENDSAYHEKMDSYGTDNAVAEVVLTFTKKIPKDANHTVNIATTTSPNIEFTQTETGAPKWEAGNTTENVQVVNGSVKQESLVILLEP